MAEMKWTTPYRSRTSGVHTRVMADNPLGTWSTDQISRFYDQLNAYFIRERERTRVDVAAGVRAEDRIDTGLMLASVEASLSSTRTEFILDFGWFDEQPHYARYQEFGTSRGIEPMRAVLGAFTGLQARLKYELQG